MSKKITLSFVAAVLLGCFTILMAEQGGGSGNGPEARSQRAFGRPGRGFGGQTGLSSFDKAPIPNSEDERKILNVLDDIAKNQSAGMMNVPPEDGRLIRLLTEAVAAKNVVEVGTSNGYSAIWFALALRNTGGKLTTFEINARRASLARENFKRAGVDGLITLIEGDAHNEVAKIKEPIDILFLDADKEGYIDYLNKLLPLVKPGGLILAHNITPGQADPKYVEAITSNPDLESVLLNGGMAVTLKKCGTAVAPQVIPKPKKLHDPDVGPVPTPQDVVEKMLEVAQVKKTDLVYDLGCGDGRIVVTAAKKYGCKAVGYDIEYDRVIESLENVKKNNVEDLVTIEQEDIFTLDLSKADVITLFLLPELNVRLIPQLEKLKPGSRIVSQEFDMEGVTPDKVVTIVSNETGAPHLIYLWTTPLKKEAKIDSTEKSVYDHNS
jgi:predicted O-methyltransferase YrrM